MVLCDCCPHPILLRTNRELSPETRGRGPSQGLSGLVVASPRQAWGCLTSRLHSALPQIPDRVICSGGHNRMPQTRCLRQQSYFCTVLEAGSPRLRGQWDQFLVRPPFPACRQPPSRCVLTWLSTVRMQRQREGIRCLSLSQGHPSYWIRALTHDLI